MPEVELNVILFAAAREAAGKSELILVCSNPSSGEALLAALVRSEPK